VAGYSAFPPQPSSRIAEASYYAENPYMFDEEDSRWDVSPYGREKHSPHHAVKHDHNLSTDAIEHLTRRWAE
jgi:hypothetical protein